MSSYWSLALFGGRRPLGGLCFALPQEPLVAKLPENIQEEDPGNAQHDQAFEQAIHRGERPGDDDPTNPRKREDRKSTRLNSSHVSISYAVFCLKKINCNLT